jgi:5-methylthioadenosine/S-adenosylhomocysteine deaminase
MSTDASEETGAVDRWIVSDRALLREDSVFIERAEAVGLAGAHIAQLLPADELRKGPRRERALALGEEIIDVGNDPLVPSFVNGHTHLALAPLRGITSLAKRKRNIVSETFFQVERHLLPADVRIFTRLGALESLLLGVGEVWDHYYFGDEVAEGLYEAGLSGAVAPTLQDLSGPGKGRAEMELASTLRIHQDERLKRAGIVVAFGPHASDTVSDALLGQVGELARKHALPVHLHLAQSSEEVESVDARFDAGLGAGVLGLLEKARVLVAHGLYLSDEECRKLAEARWVLGYCPFSQLQFGVLSPFSSWLKAGGKWVLGTDCVASNDSLDVQRELPLAAGEASLVASFSPSRKKQTATGGLPEARATERARREHLAEVRVADSHLILEAAWGYPLSGLFERPAGIAVGALANLITLDGEHPSLFPGDDLARTLAYGSTSGAIRLMIVAGNVRGCSDGLTREILDSPLYRETVKEARQRRVELLRRAGIPSERVPS